MTLLIKESRKREPSSENVSKYQNKRIKTVIVCIIASHKLCLR